VNINKILSILIIFMFLFTSSCVPSILSTNTEILNRSDNSQYNKLMEQMKQDIKEKMKNKVPYNGEIDRLLA